MTKKDIAIIVLKTIIYVAGLVLAALGVSAMASCTVSRQSSSVGRAVVVTTDTTVIDHSGVLEFHPLHR